MNVYTYIKNNNEINMQNQEITTSAYANRSNINIAKIFRNEKEYSHTKIENYIDQIIDMLSTGDRLIVAELKILGNSIFNILKRIERAYLKSISIYSVKENLLISRENQVLHSMVVALLDIEKSLKNKKLIDAEKTRQKNGTNLGRKSGKRTKSMFDSDKKKIMKLHRKGVPKTKILAEIKKGNEKLKHTSPQALGQYIKKVEHSLEIRKKMLSLPISYFNGLK